MIRWGKTEARDCPALRSAVITVTLNTGCVATKRTIYPSMSPTQTNPPHFKPQTIWSQHRRLCSLWLFTFSSHTTPCPGNAEQIQQFNTYFSHNWGPPHSNLMQSNHFLREGSLRNWRRINNKTISQMLMTFIPQILCTHWHQEQPLGWSPSDPLSRISLLLDSSVPMLRSC